MKKIRLFLPQTFSFLIFLYLTGHEENETLMSFLQQHHLILERFKGQQQKTLHKNWASFSQNANFVIRSNQNISLKDFLYISQFLSSHVLVLAFYYHEQVWTASRLKHIQTFSLQNKEKSNIVSAVCQTCWKVFSQQNF